MEYVHNEIDLGNLFIVPIFVWLPQCHWIYLEQYGLMNHDQRNVCMYSTKKHATNKEYFDTVAHFTYAFSFTYQNLIVNLVVTPLVDKLLQKLTHVMLVELSCRVQKF